jgi:amino acid transporter
MAAGTRLRRPDSITNALAADRLGVTGVIYFVMSAAAPLTATAGVVTTGYAVSELNGIPVAFLAVGVIMAIFSVGYVAMARHMVNAGAFYAYISQGLGKTPGIMAAWVALLSYNAMVFCLYGAISAAALPLVEKFFGFSPPWWIIALLVWAIVGVLGVMRVEVNGNILAVLLTLEVLVIVLFDFTNLLHPAVGGLSVETLSPGALFAPGIGALLAIVNLGFIGYESSVVFAEESRNPRRTVPIATYLAVAIISILYAFSAWTMTVATGPGNIVAVAQRDGAETFFKMTEPHLGSGIITIAQTLFVTGVFACSVSFHNTTARYIFALGRERVFPETFGRTVARSGAPKAASIAQTVLGFLIIVFFAIFGLDPLVHLFYYVGTVGGVGILLLMLVTSLAVIGYFRHRPEAENTWRRLVAPAIATVALTVVMILVLANMSTLLGVEEGDPIAWMLPSLFIVAGGVGLIWAVVLRNSNPDAYARIGLGAKAATTPVSQPGPAGPPVGSGPGAGTPPSPGSPVGARAAAYSGPGTLFSDPETSGPGYRDMGPGYRAYAAGASPSPDTSYLSSEAPSGPGYRAIRSEYQNTGQVYRESAPARHDAGQAYHDAGQAFRDAGQAYRDAGPAYRDTAPAHHDAGPAYRDAAPAPHDAGPGYDLGAGRCLDPAHRCMGRGCRYLINEAQANPEPPYSGHEAPHSAPDNRYQGPDTRYSGPGSRYLRPGSQQSDRGQPDGDS